MQTYLSNTLEELKDLKKVEKKECQIFHIIISSSTSSKDCTERPLNPLRHLMIYKSFLFGRKHDRSVDRHQVSENENE